MYTLFHFHSELLNNNHTLLNGKGLLSSGYVIVHFLLMKSLQSQLSFRIIFWVWPGILYIIHISIHQNEVVSDKFTWNIGCRLGSDYGNILCDGSPGSWSIMYHSGRSTGTRYTVHDVFDSDWFLELYSYHTETIRLAIWITSVPHVGCCHIGISLYISLNSIWKTHCRTDSVKLTN